jgi:sigma-B regulation protein RsbU (phosphoserine phosphatase)
MLGTAENGVRSTKLPDFTTKPSLQYAVLGLLLVWALLAQLTFIGFILYVQANAAYDLAAPFITRVYTTEILHLAPTYENSGLKIGDQVLAVNGVQVKGAEQIDDLLFRLHPRSTLAVTVRRTVNGGSRILNIPVVMHAAPPQRFGWITVLGLRVFLPLSCLVIGFYIAFARPRDPLAWITLGMLASFGELLGRENWAIWSPWREIFLVYFSVLNSLWPLWLVLFALHFPVPFRFIRKRLWLNWIVALPFLFLAAISLYGDLMAGNHVKEITGLAHFIERIENPARILITIYVSAFFMLLGFKSGVLETSDARRRLRVMMTGCSLSLAPLLIVVFCEVGVLPPLPNWAVTVCLLMLVFFPITMAYVIVVQRAMDVQMVIRTGIRYALASTGVKILRFVFIAAVAALTLHFALESGHHVHAFLIAAIGAMLIFGLGRAAASVSRWMDRRFFREAYNTELILAELSSSVAGIRDTRALLETVTRRISDSLHVSRIAVLLERGDRYEPAYALGYDGTAPPVELKRDASTIRLLKQARSPSKIYFDDPQSWVHGASEKEQAALQALDAQVLLPLNPNNRMLGVISLGPKRSEAPYSRADLQLLGAVASQTGLALENARLTESIRQEVAQRERLNRELEIARDVQQRLFPQKLPNVEGLDFAGYCRPAYGVGGDYYDFIKLSDGCMGIAIGDVSGKGIAAALMMASLQASLRGQTIKPCETLSEMIEHVNRLVYDASADNRYATFFYAQYDPANRMLRYVNAGHNPPILYRKRMNGRQIVRLAEGGTVIGLFPAAPYQEARLTLHPGDIMVAFTDGVSEAMNNTEEEWDEERLIETIQNCNSRSAADMISCILERVDTFTAGARQHDDMTLVVMRVQ